MDFIDLDADDDFADNNFIPQPHNEELKSLFITSNPPPCSEASTKKSANVSIKLVGKRMVVFNPKGVRFEGRDSQVFKGEIIDESISNMDSPPSFVAVKISSEAVVTKEASLSTLLKSSEFAQLIDHGPFNDEFFSIWEWIDGGNLEFVASKHPEIFSSQDFKFKTVKSLASALDKLHSLHIVHHDLKPHNILFTSTLDRLVIIDFGDSKRFRSEEPSVLLPIDEGIGLGTLAYTAPELLSRKSQFYDPFAADVYSFGVLLYYILNDGKILPFQSLIPNRAVHLILTVQKGFFAGGYNPEGPTNSPFHPLMIKCLQLDPKSRPNSREILNAVLEIIK